MVSKRQGANIKVSPKTRDCIKRQKRAGETYDELLAKMAKQYNPAETDGKGSQ